MKISTMMGINIDIVGMKRETDTSESREFHPKGTVRSLPCERSVRPLFFFAIGLYGKKEIHKLPLIPIFFTPPLDITNWSINYARAPPY